MDEPVTGDPSEAGAGTDQRVHELRRRLEALLGIPATEGNALTVLRNGDEIFPAMLEGIRGATRTVDLLTFAYWKGDIAEEFAAALSERARAGVTVRVLIDAVGGRLMESTLLERMSSAGVQVEWFRTPVWQGKLLSPLKHNHRTHRKVLVCDEVVGFTGGVGIAEEWCGDARNEHEWRDTHVRVTGPAVDGLSATTSSSAPGASPSTSAPPAVRACRWRGAARASAGTTWPPSSASCSSRRRSGSA
jgi:cardiolipin synthase